ncbi:MAG: hypothetical protein AB1631_28885, partial [Acidobacteriota bacterium]
MKRVKRYTEEEARKLLADAIDRAGSQGAFAAANGLSRQYLSDILNGRRDMSGKILSALGLKKIVEFEPLN